MKTVSFYERPLNDKGHYQEQGILRSDSVWQEYRRLENLGVRFYIEISEDILLIARCDDIECLLSMVYPNNDSIGENIDLFIAMTSATLDRQKNGTTIVKQELSDENLIDKSSELSELSEDRLDSAERGTFPDRWDESGDRSCQYGGQDNSA